MSKESKENFLKEREMKRTFQPEKYVGPEASLSRKKRVSATLETMRMSLEAGFLIGVAGTPPPEIGEQSNSVEEFKKRIEEYFPGWFKLMRLLEEAEKEEFSRDMGDKWKAPIMKKEEISSKSLIRPEYGEKILRLKDVFNWCLGGMVGKQVFDAVQLEKTPDEFENLSLPEFRSEVKNLLGEVVKKHRKTLE